jgi:hypothetical protein
MQERLADAYSGSDRCAGLKLYSGCGTAGAVSSHTPGISIVIATDGTISHTTGLVLRVNGKESGVE